MQISKFSLWLCALTVCGGMTLHADDSAAQAAARAALLQKMNELGSNSVAAPPQAAPAKTAPATEAKAPVKVKPAPATAAPMATMTTEAGDTPAQAAARAALEQKLQQLGGGSMPSTAGAPATATTAAPSGKASSEIKGELQVTPPPAPVNMSKLDRLHWLNSLYKAGNLSPEQYQQQRAAILANP